MGKGFDIRQCVAALCIMLVGYIIGSKKAHIEPQKPEIITYTKTDTIVLKEPVLTYIKQVDTVRVTDLVVEQIKDTVYINVPIEKKVYKDTLYYAEISGYRPNLDYIEVYNKTETKYIQLPPPERKRFSLGVHAGYGVCATGLTPYIGIGISYNFYNFNL